MKNLTFIILVAVLSFVALTIVHAHAISSIDELEDQVNETIGYRGELSDYIISHNLTLMKSEFSYATDELEQIVKQHVEDCQSGAFEDKKKLLEETLGGPANNLFGTCEIEQNGAE